MSELSKLRLQILQTQNGDYNENFTADLISAQSLIRKCENLIRVSIKLPQKVSSLSAKNLC